MILYPDTEKELFFEKDYKCLPEGLKNETIESLLELKDNLFDACGNAFINHADLLESCLFDDMQTVKQIITRKKIQARKAGKKQ